jgi:hypothetical protein
MELCWRRCEAAGKRLVIRDWSHLDFMGVPFVRPTFRLTTAECLQGRFDLRQAALVRHPVDQLLSLSKLGVVQGKIVVPELLEGYRRFAEQAVRIGFFGMKIFWTIPTRFSRGCATSFGSHSIPLTSSAGPALFSLFLRSSIDKPICVCTLRGTDWGCRA